MQHCYLCPECDAKAIEILKMRDRLPSLTYNYECEEHGMIMHYEVENWLATLPPPKTIEISWEQLKAAWMNTQDHSYAEFCERVREELYKKEASDDKN